MAIPIKYGKSPAIQLLHPEFRDRLDRFLNDPQMKGYAVLSAVRTYAEQKYLYDGYIAGKQGFNLAANPDRVVGTVKPEGFTMKGSWHMQQESGWGYAVDLSKPWRHSRSYAQGLINGVAPHYGIRRTVPSEWWHVQPRNFYGWFTDYAEPPPELNPPLPALPITIGDVMIVFDPTNDTVYTVNWDQGTYRKSGKKDGQVVPVYPNFGYVLADFSLRDVTGVAGGQQA